MLLLQPSISLRLGLCVDILYAIAIAFYILKARSMCGGHTICYCYSLLWLGPCVDMLYAIATAFYIVKARSMCGGHTICYCYSLLYR